MIEVKQITPPIKLPGLTSLTVKFPYDKRLVDTIHQVPSAIWHKKEGVWEVPITSLSKLVNLLSNYTEIQLVLDENDIGDNLYYDGVPEQNSVILSGNYKVDLFEHQKEGIQYGLTHDKFLLLDQPGLGKTLQMIYLAEELREQKGLEHCFIICGLNTLKYNWKKEIEKFSNYGCRILGERVTKSGKTRIGSVKERIEDLQNPIEEFFIITNIETLRNDEVIKELRKKKPVNKFDMMVLDECHVCKNPSSQQGKNLLKLSSKYMVGLTGTLLLNSPLDAYVPLKWLGMDNSTYSNYKYYYCRFTGPFNNIITGYQNTDVLKDQLERCALRRTKDLLDLPEKTIIHEELEMDDKQEKFYKEVVRGVCEEVDKVELKSTNVLSNIIRLRQATACPSILSTSNIESVKINRAVDLVEQIVAGGDKVVIFSVFKPTLDELSEKLSQYNPLVCTGDLKDEVISTNIDKFQNDNNCKVILCTTAKMGTGITLNKASYAIFIDAPWTSAQCQQCEDRIHRIGSNEPVFIYYLWAKDTVDMRVKKVVQTKEAIADYIVDDKLDDSTYEDLKQYILDLAEGVDWE